MKKRISRSAQKPLVISEVQASAMLNVSVRTLKELRYTGDGPSFVQLTHRRIGYQVEELQLWVKSRLRQSSKSVAAKVGGAA